MRPYLLFLIGALAGAPAAAQTYRWVDEHGVTNYGPKPPQGRPAQLVDTQPRGPIDTPETLQKRQELDARRRADGVPPPPAPNIAAREPPRYAAPAPRGMEFDTFIRLQRGMTEGELLVRAGRPDQVSVENLQSLAVKSYYYYPTSGDPYITVVTVRGGLIDNIERTKKF
jgi:hypothetical protein